MRSRLYSMVDNEPTVSDSVLFEKSDQSIHNFVPEFSYQLNEFWYKLINLFYIKKNLINFLK